MKNSNNKTSQIKQETKGLKKCPYQILIYGEHNCDVIYTRSYKGDWGDWDEITENDHKKNQNSKSSPFDDDKKI